MKLIAPSILKATVQTGENKERLMALCWRESLCSFALDPKGSVLGWGDHGNAFGPFQVDKRYHADFIKAELGRAAWCEKENLPYTAAGQAFYACDLLRANREWFKRSASSFSGDLLERATYAAYNAGVGAVRKSLLLNSNSPGGSNLAVDLPTTGKNYSASIWAVASVLQQPVYQWIWND